MYPILVALHSWMRWLVLISLLFALYRAYRGWFGKLSFTRSDNTVRHTTATILHIQFLLGLWLYFISPLVDYFLHHFKDAMHERQARFFGLEHITVMLLAIVVVTIGSAKAKRKRLDKQKFKNHGHLVHHRLAAHPFLHPLAFFSADQPALVERVFDL